MIPVRKLRGFDETSGGVTLPKEDLRKAGVLEDDGSLAPDCYVKIEGDADETGALAEWELPRYREELCRRSGVASLEELELEVWEEIPESVLIDALRQVAKVAEEAGERLTPQVMDGRGGHDPELYTERFESWEAALEEAGLTSDSEADTDEDGVAETTDTDSSGTTDNGTQDTAGPPSEVFDEDDSGFVLNGRYYEASEEQIDRMHELLEIDDGEDTCEEFIERLLDAVEFYQDAQSESGF